MYIKRGSCRFVLIVPCLGLAFKLPIINPYRAVWSVIHAFKAGKHSWRFAWHVAKAKTKEIPTPWLFLFAGINENLSEYNFYCRDRHPFLWPTLFSFFGLINVQRIANVCQMPLDSFWPQMKDITNRAVYRSRHHFEKSENFCWNDDGQLCILDYASKKTQDLVIEFGSIIQQKFKPATDLKEAS